ncbi:hypothetical protein QBC40DRAFT_163541, partial [Triangularia verruculosa]
QEVDDGQYVRPARLRGRTDFRGKSRDSEGEPAHNWHRGSNLTALIAQTRGQDAPTPCKRCRRGLGPFAECIISDEFSTGSCANCNFNDKASFCSFRKIKK